MLEEGQYFLDFGFQTGNNSVILKDASPAQTLPFTHASNVYILLTRARAQRMSQYSELANISGVSGPSER